MTKSNDKSRRIGGGGAKYQIWSKVECIQFEQNVIKHGWGNWRNMRIPTRTSQQIKSHAQKVKKLYKESHERLLREHEVANRTVDLRTNMLVGGGGGDAKRKRGGKAPQASPAHKKTSTSIKVKIRGILRNSSNIVVTCSAIDKATPSPIKMITRKQIIPAKPSFDTIKIARKDNVVIATTCMLQQHRTFTPPPSPLPNSTEMEGLTPLPFVDALVFDATVGAVKSPAFFDVMFPSHRYRAFEDFDEVPALSTVTTSPILKRDYSSPLERIVRKNDPGLDTVANSLESKETFTKSNIYLCRSNIQLPPNVNPDKQLFMKYHAHLTSPPDVNNPAEYADIVVDYIIGLDGISRAGIDKGELCRARIKKLLNEHLNTGWWRKDALDHIIETTEKLSFKKFALERLVALIAVMMNVDSWHVLPTTGKTIADNVYDDICHVGWLLSGLWKRVGRSRDGLALLNCVDNRERYTAIKMLVAKLDMISRQTRL